ncbi:alpha/beta fold hydrolase [Bifidobacterium choloepi]|uniref:Alpha/beta hydrolase n=1 Tax=Bifidobacterium choloepi TaxID=2614131 RepID=A0A6I5N327_9BIFI|nr:alpha/beta hydrolase [Bifidobacterium choloepi]NEG70595.1 alpha/beta hydrolase [Bifidobacterium choloepi]
MEIAMLDETNFAAAIDGTVLPALESCRTDGYMEPAHEIYSGHPLPALRHPNGTSALGKLHYVTYDVAEFQKLGVPGASRQFHGAVVLSHGFSEFADKYRELAWYFLLAGFSVCILEHRGHGYSPRDVDDKDIVYIDDWHRYVADFAKFAAQVGRPAAKGCRLALFAHSMGGGIATALLERYPKLIDRAVLSSPMIAPDTHIPNWLAAGTTGFLSDLGLAKAKAPGMHNFEPEVNWKDNPGASVARVQWFHDLRMNDSHYQTTAAANMWVKQAVRLSHAILQDKMVRRIQTPILMFQAGNDLWVLNVAENEFKEKLDRAGGRIEMDRIPKSAHEIFSMPNAVYAPYLKRILRYLQSSEKVTVLA